MGTNDGKPVVLFYCATGHNLGMGHLYRSRMLLHAVAGRGSLLVVKPERSSREFLESSLVPWQTVDEHLADGSLGLRLSELAGRAGARAVVLDCKDNSRELVLSLRQNGLAIIDLEDLGPGRLEADLLLDPHIQPGSPEAEYDGRAEVCYGPSWALLDPVYTRYRASAPLKPHAGPALTVTVSLGGSDPSGLTSRVVESLAAADEVMNIEVVLGPAAERTAFPDPGSHFIRVHHSLPGLAGLLRRSDLALVGGGITMFESLCMGVPTVVVPQHEEQHRNASRLAARDALLLAPPPSREGAGKKLNEIIAAILADPDKRKKMAAAGIAIVDGSAVERLGMKIKQMAGRKEHGKFAPLGR
jgi:spore coat polysaccharide biosynthesis predicted glycosyltransferase SpsG